MEKGITQEESFLASELKGGNEKTLYWLSWDELILLLNRYKSCVLLESNIEVARLKRELMIHKPKEEHVG